MNDVYQNNWYAKNKVPRPRYNRMNGRTVYAHICTC